MHVLPSTWTFKCKCYPDGEVKQLKAKFCVRGDKLIHGVDYFETYAPVVQWETIRLLLSLSIRLNLITSQVDYTTAFVQVSVDYDVHCEIPRSYREDGKLLKLKWNLYRLHQGPKNFFALLKNKILTIEFMQSTSDPCLFMKEDCVYVVYVDDCLFFAQNQTIIDNVIEGIRDEGIALKKEDDVAGFLGVQLIKHKDGRIKRTQTGLIKRIISTMGLEGSNPKGTPSLEGTLTKDYTGDSYNEGFNYASVVGMLMYRQGHSRPDITFSVNQCARYTFAPKQSHQESLKRIGRYLVVTVDEGIIFTPTNDFCLHCYLDSDFVGQWNYEDQSDLTSVRSRSRFVFLFDGYPVSWKSKLQTGMALSTMEAEYVALSTVMENMIPLRQLVIDVCRAVGVQENDLIKLSSDVWEDNEGALTLVKLEPPRMTPRYLGLGVYQKEKVTLNQTTKGLAITSSTSNESQKRKSDFIDSFRAPRKLVVEILHPIEYDTKDEKEKTTSTDSIGVIEIDFSRFIIDNIILLMTMISI